MRDGFSQAAVDKPTIYPAIGVYMDFEAGPVRLWSCIGIRNLPDDFGGGNYTGVGNLGEITPVQEDLNDLGSNGIELSIAGIDAASIALVQGSRFRNRAVVVSLYFFNTPACDDVDPLRTVYFRGIMDSCIIQESKGTCKITIKCESRLVELKRSNPRRYTHTDQQSRYPTDTFFEYVTSATTQEIFWGYAAS